MKTKDSLPPARDRLLRAAATVFARDGLAGATTRGIAQEAGVNEVTLFRLFGSKEGLLSAVVTEHFGAAALASLPQPPALTGNLRVDLTAHAEIYERALQQNLPLVRAMIGEIHHHGENERQVFTAVFRPLRDSLLACIEMARTRGELREEIPSQLLADLLVGTIFSGVLRRAAPHLRRDYPARDYVTGAVDVLLRGACKKVKAEEL